MFLRADSQPSENDNQINSSRKTGKQREREIKKRNEKGSERERGEKEKATDKCTHT